MPGRTAASKIVSNHLEVLAGTMAIWGRQMLEECNSINAVKKTCLATRIPNIRALVSSLIVGLNFQDSQKNFVKAIADELYTEILSTWKIEVMRQFEAKTQELGNLAKVITTMNISGISKKLEALKG